MTVSTNYAVSGTPLSNTNSAAIEALVSGAGKGPLPVLGSPLALGIDASNAISPVNCTIEYVSRVSPSGVKLRGIRVTSTGLTACSVGFTFQNPSTIPSGNISFLLFADDGLKTIPAGLGLTLYLGDNTFANVYKRTVGISRPGFNVFSPVTPTAAGPSKWVVDVGTPAFGTTSFNKASVRADFTSGQVAVFEVYAVCEAPACSPAPITFVFDDGYISQYNIAAPLLEKYGLRGSFSVIASAVGSNGLYMTWDQLRDLRDRGHEINVHGPIGGTGSLANYNASPTRAADVLADLLYNKNAVIDNGCNVNGSENCYVLPQGYNQIDGADRVIHEALELAQMKFVRSVETVSDPSLLPWGSLDSSTYSKILGHSWVSEGTEVANIIALQARIAENATAKKPSMLMFHYIVAGTPVSGLEIKTSNLELLCKTTAAQVAAGLALNTTMTGHYKAANGVYPV